MHASRAIAVICLCTLAGCARQDSAAQKTADAAALEAAKMASRQLEKDATTNGVAAAAAVAEATAAAEKDRKTHSAPE